MKTRSARLLRRVIDAGDFTLDQIAHELVVSRRDVELYAEGTQVMPLQNQLCLALFVIAKSPRLARLGHALRVQISATADFHAHATTTHSGPPARWPRER